MSAPVAVALATAGCAAANLAPNAVTEVAAPEAAAPTDAAAATEASGDAIAVVEVDVVDINRLRCEPVTRTGSRIVIAERCYPVGSKTPVDEDALAEQLEQVRRDQEDLDRRRREAEERRGPGL